jgi:prepilin-type processing-associated H-X9-DG protein/prepilin-type N-terminal cleavage/methylation domain-containing protein
MPVIVRTDRATGAAECAFTLIELLVVITIIAVLAGLLAAGVVSAHNSAQAAECASNLHQLAAANILYAGDHDGRYVTAQDPTNLIRWHGVRTSTSATFDPTKGPLAPYLGLEGKVKLCPTFRDALTGKDTFEQGSGGYGYNEIYIGGTPSNYFTGELISNVWNPARTVMFTDTAFARSDGIQEYPFSEPYEWVDPSGALAGPMSASVHFRHAGKANVAWCDGHVTAEAYTVLDENNYYGGDASKWKIGWLGPSTDNGYWNPRRANGTP